MKVECLVDLTYLGEPHSKGDVIEVKEEHAKELPNVYKIVEKKKKKND